MSLVWVIVAVVIAEYAWWRIMRPRGVKVEIGREYWDKMAEIEAREEAEEREKGIEVWRVTRETAEIESARAAEKAKRREMERGLKKCSVCRGRARIVEFGLGGNGVWVGCAESAECSRYIEMHSEGWSVEECVGEWNRYNSGIFLVLRKAKKWIRDRFGAEKRAERREKRAKEGEKQAKIERMREIFGVERPKKVGKLEKMWQRVKNLRGGKSFQGGKPRAESKKGDMI